METLQQLTSRIATFPSLIKHAHFYVYATEYSGDGSPSITGQDLEAMCCPSSSAQHLKGGCLRLRTPCFRVHQLNEWRTRLAARAAHRSSLGTLLWCSSMLTHAYDFARSQGVPSYMRENHHLFMRTLPRAVRATCFKLPTEDRGSTSTRKLLSNPRMRE